MMQNSIIGLKNRNNIYIQNPKHLNKYTKSIAFSSYMVINENTEYRNIITLILILSPIILFNSDSSTAVFGQVERQNLITTDSSVCQIVDGNKSLIGSSYQQASNLCEHQNSTGSTRFSRIVLYFQR